MKPTKFILTLSAILLSPLTSHVLAADDIPAPVSPAGRPTREELRERVKNLTPAERQARIKEFRERLAQGTGSIARAEFQKRRLEMEKLRDEIKSLPPAERQAKIREFRENGGLPRPGLGLGRLSSEEREAKRKQFQERVQKEISFLQEKKTNGSLDEDGERSLRRMEMISKRLEQGGPLRPGKLAPPRDQPADK